MSARIDLHIHTSASDGADTTDKIIADSINLGLKAIAITDHDTVSGIPSSLPSGIELVPGLEFSTKYMTKTHILGYFIDLDNKPLKDALQSIVDARDIRNEQIAAAMRSDGIQITYSEMKDRFGDVVGRPHFGEILMEEGICSSIAEAFDKYLNRGEKYWFKMKTLALEDAISLIVNAGGVAVLAHPFEYSFEKNSLSELIEYCINLGLKGIECRHSSHTPGQMAYLESIASEYGLYKTGGSDYHGNIKPDISLGSGKGFMSVPYEWLEILKSARK